MSPFFTCFCSTRYWANTAQSLLCGQTYPPPERKHKIKFFLGGQSVVRGSVPIVIDLDYVLVD